MAQAFKKVSMPWSLLLEFAHYSLALFVGVLLLSEPVTGAQAQPSQEIKGSKSLVKDHKDLRLLEPNQLIKPELVDSKTYEHNPQKLKSVSLIAATPQDNNRAAAERAYAEADHLVKQGTAESLRRAIKKFEEALPLWRTVGDRSKEATTLNNIGFVYNSLGEKQKALDFFNQSLPLLRTVGDRSGEATTLNNIGSVYNSLGEKQKALEYYNQALPLSRAVGDRSKEATTLNNIGFVYNSLGEKQKALEYYNQALPLSRAVGDRAREAAALNNIGFVYDSLGEKQKALEYYNQSLPLLRTVGDRSGEAAALNNIGSVYDSLGEKQKALDFFNQALPLSRAVGDRSGEAVMLSNIGLVYNSLGEKQKALEYYNQALPLSRAVGDRSGEANTLNNIGGVYDSLGEKQKALEYYNQALPLSRAVGNRSKEAITLSNIADVERDRGNLNQALTQTEAAIKIIEDLRTSIVSQELRTSYFASVQGYYKFYIDLLMQLHKRNPSEGFDAVALQASERGRARGLLEVLTEAQADIRQGVDPTLLKRERSLQQQLNARAESQRQLLSGKHTEAQAAAVKKEIEALLSQYQDVEAQIRQRSPRYAALTQPQPLNLQQIQQQVLDSDTLLLEYSLGEERSYLWAVTPTSISSYELPKATDIEAAAKRFRNLLNNSSAQPAEVAKASADLSQMLLAPVAKQLGKKRLLIVSDGALQYVPFSALLKPTTGQSSTQSQQPLLVEHEIVTLPSASTLAVLRRDFAGRQPAAKQVAILADPVFDSSDERIRTPKTKDKPGAPSPTSDSTRTLSYALRKSVRDSEVELKRLPGTRQEAEQILTLVPQQERQQAFDFTASRATATSPSLSQYRIVHFATHGLLDSINPELSGIVLSLVDQKGASQDGFLRLHDIYNLKLPAELVVLSACQTGLGEEVKGEGLVGLTRGFMYAGAKRVAVSLWNVDDQATAELMGRFYRGMLKENLRPAAALRAAQIEMWKQKQWQAPYYWAAFELQGEWR